MSLLDALLLDPPRIDVWVANRNDGVSGTGTAIDPFNTAVILTGLQLSITSFSVAGQVVTATCTNSYAAGDVVQISGSSDPLLNNVFTVETAVAASFTFRTNTTATGGGAAKVQKVTQFQFDTVMSDPTKVGPNTCVHLGPGTFITAGFYEGITGTWSGWQIQAGMRLVGSGMDVTILRRVNKVTLSAKKTYAIGHELTKTTPSISTNLVDFAEISEMTIDANVVELLSGTSLSAGGIRMMGNYARATKVKLINWGNQSSTTPSFGIALLTANTNSGNVASNVSGVISCGIDSCIAMNPGTSAGNLIALYVGAKESPGSTEGLGVSPYLTNSFVDCGTTTNTTLIGLGMTWCDSGIVSGNRVQNAYWGLGANVTFYAGGRSTVIRGNGFRNVDFGIFIYPQPGLARQDLQIIDNYIEIATDAGVSGKAAITVVHAVTAVPGTVLIQKNYMRNADGSAVPIAVNVDLSTGTKLQVQENTVEAVPSAGPSPIYFNHTAATAPYYFENRTASGTLIQGRNLATGELLTELATDSDDAFILSLLLRH